MTPDERFKQIEMKYGPYGMGSPEDVRWLIARVKRLTEALEKKELLTIAAQTSEVGSANYLRSKIYEFDDIARKALQL